MSRTTGKPAPGGSAPLDIAGMSSHSHPSSTTKPRSAPKSMKFRAPPNPPLPSGHCWDFCRGSCRFGVRCRYKHDEAVKKAFKEKKRVLTLPKPHYTYALAASKPVAENVTPKLQKANVTQSNVQDPTPPATPNDAKQAYNQNSKNLELTPSSTPDWGSNQTASEIRNAVLWNACRPTNNAETDSWVANRHYIQIDDITTQVFQKIYSTSAKLPHLTTKFRRSGNENVQTLAEIAEAALRCAQKQVLSSNIKTSKPVSTDEKDVTVKAAECYKKILLAGKISNVLNKTEQAHLDVIIASQHWNAQLPVTTNAPSTKTSQVSKSVANSPQQCDPLQRSNNVTKTWGHSDYLAWAKSNLTDATAIKLARTYCQSLQNGTVPMSLFARMGKQAPPGTSFEYFSLLPYELREQVWLLVLQDEKNDVRLTWHHAEKDGHFTHNSFDNANNQQRLLFVNRELRELALRHNYERAFGTHYSPPKTFFDFARDRLFLHSRCPRELPRLVRSIRTKDALRVQNLAVPLRDFVQGNEHRVAEALCKFKNVKRIHLVCGDGLEDVMYCGAGDAQLARKIQRFFYGIWRKHNDPKCWPKICMYTLPAMIAHDFKIDNMLF